MTFRPATNGLDVALGYQPANADFALVELGPAVTDAAGNISAPLIPAQPAAPIIASGTAAAAAINAQTLAGAAGKTTYIRGFSVRTGAPAAVETGVVVVSGLLGGSLSFQIVESVATGGELHVTFADPLPASAVNTGVVVTLPAITGGAVSTVAAWGFQR